MIEVANHSTDFMLIHNATIDPSLKVSTLIMLIKMILNINRRLLSKEAIATHASKQLLHQQANRNATTIAVK